MPTSRPRYMITESDRLAQALDEAGNHWPELAGNRAALLRRIIDTGVGELEARRTNDSNQRRDTIEQLAGIVNGVWPNGWREQASDEWPE